MGKRPVGCHMITAEVPLARIMITANPMGLLIEAGDQSGHVPLPGLRISELRDLKLQLPDLLRNFRQTVGHQDLSLDETYARQASDQLDIWAAGLAARLVGGSQEGGPIERDVESEIAWLLAPALRASADEAPVIELSSDPAFGTEDPASFFPIEFLRVIELARSRAPRDVLARVLGLRAVVSRGECTSQIGLVGGPTVPVSALIYEGEELEGPERQAAFFDRHRGTFRTQRWPQGTVFPTNDLVAEGQLVTDLETAVAAAFVKEVLTVAGLVPVMRPNYNGAIVHIACHYHAEPIAELDQSAPFLSFRGHTTNVGIESLWNAFNYEIDALGPRSRVGRTARERFGQMIVFVNACATGARLVHGVSLLEKLFRIGFRHIIASESLIPDPLSDAFARQLYLALMRGLPLGAAVLQARIDLVERHNNPGGLLYTLYGDPWLRLGAST
jgi:hypothetical protein